MSEKQWTSSEVRALYERLAALPESAQRWLIGTIRAEVHRAALSEALRAKGGGQ